MIIDNKKILDWADQTEGILVQFHESKESEFTMLVNNGFLGTRELHSDILKELIKEYFLTGKAVLLAIETNLKNNL